MISTSLSRRWSLRAGPLALEARRRALADIAVAADDRELAGEHHVGGALDAVDQALAAAVEVVEFRLGDAVVDVDRRRLQRAVAHHRVEPVDSSRRRLRPRPRQGDQGTSRDHEALPVTRRCQDPPSEPQRKCAASRLRESHRQCINLRQALGKSQT